MTRDFEKDGKKTRAGIGFSAVAGVVLIGATFLGTQAAGTPTPKGPTNILTQPLPGVANPFANPGQGSGRQAQSGYCYYYGYSPYTNSSGQYCCYDYYGYTYCYDQAGSSSPGFLDGTGFSGRVARREPAFGGINAGGFAAAPESQSGGSPAHDGSALAGSGALAGPAAYNNTFL